MGRNSRERALETRKKLLEISVRLFKENGYQKTTIDDICKEAKLTKGAFYTHLKNKSEILVNIWKDTDEFISQEIRYQNIPAAKEKLLSLSRASLHQSELMGREFTGVVFSTQMMENDPSFMVNKNRLLYHVYHGIITTAQSQNEIRKDLDADAIVDMIFIFLRGLIMDWIFHEGIKLEEFGTRQMSIFLDLFDPSMEMVSSS